MVALLDDAPSRRIRNASAWIAPAWSCARVSSTPTCTCASPAILIKRARDRTCGCGGRRIHRGRGHAEYASGHRHAGARRALVREAKARGGPHCYPIGAVDGREGETIAALRRMAAAGAVAFSDDGAATRSLKTLYNAARSSPTCRNRFSRTARTPSFSDALMHEGDLSDLFGVPVRRRSPRRRSPPAICLSHRRRGKAWHLCHVSARKTLDVFRWARASAMQRDRRSDPASPRTARRSLARLQRAQSRQSAAASAADGAALRQAVADGVITIFASDHAPHAEAEKEPPLAHACVGFTGLETAVGATFHALPDVPLTSWWRTSQPTWPRCSASPGHAWLPGSPADITGLYLERPWTVEPRDFRSLGRVTPFAGTTFTVRPALVGGRRQHRHARRRLSPSALARPAVKVKR